MLTTKRKSPSGNRNAALRRHPSSRDAARGARTPELKQVYDMASRLQTLTGDLELARAEIDAQSRAGAREATASHALQSCVDALLSDSSRVQEQDPTNLRVE
jgi:hypothetical protein